MKRYSIEIKGATPYLQNKFPGAFVLERTKPRVVKTVVPDVDTKAYVDEHGKFYIPSVHLERCIAMAGKNFKGRGRSSLYTILTAMVTISPTMITDFKPQKYVIDEQIGNNPNAGRGGNKVQILRPRFDAWEARFMLAIDTEDISDDTMKQILTFAGSFVGIGDFRPLKGGKFGRFRVTKFENVD